MKISYKWLKEFVPGLKASPQVVAERLAQSGLEVEGITEQGAGFKNVVVGRVVSVAKHPQADRLSVCRVTDGKETCSIVCGAPNVTAGKNYPLAKVGARLQDDFEIKKAVIRGVESFGMLCSAKELGLSEKSEGLFALDDNALPGKPFADYQGLNDVILEVNVAPNRGDCLSHLGIAREVSALFDLKLSVAKNREVRSARCIKDYVKVRVRDTLGCYRYCSRVIRFIDVGPSPSWLADRLSLLGVRPVNNVVDAANYIMLKTGHPLHAFDHRFIHGGVLEIRRAGSSQKFETLDHKVCDLLPDDLVIASAEAPVAIAGIMGGKNSEIRNDSTIVVLEAAAFDPLRVRRTAKRLGIQTDSSVRFERFVPSESVFSAMEELTRLILEIAGGEASNTIDIYSRKPKKLHLKLHRDRLLRMLGPSFPASKVMLILKTLNLKPARGKSGWKVFVPHYRSDLTREIDLIEEVVRLAGFSGIRAELPTACVKPVCESKESINEDFVRDFFSSRGFYETIHYSFCSAGEIEKTTGAIEEAVAIKNPISQDMAFLRPSLLYGLLSTWLKNHGDVSSVPGRYFELRSVYHAGNVEKKMLAGLFGGPLFEPNWQNLRRETDFFDGKGLLDDFFAAVRLPDYSFEHFSGPVFHPAQAVAIRCGENILGRYGRLHPLLLARHEISGKLYFFDIDYSLLAELWGSKKMFFKPLSPYPGIVRDLALVADKGLVCGDILSAIKERNIDWLAKIYLFDVYEGEKIPAGKKSLALSLTYENMERTLTDEEVNKAHFGLVDYLREKLGVALR